MRGLWILILLSTFAGCLTAEDSDPVDDPAPEATNQLWWTHRGDATLLTGHNITPEWWPIGEDAREPTLAVDSLGNLYYAARDYSGGSTPPVSATQTPIMKSSDGGKTWEDVSPRLPTGDREPPRSGDPMVVIDPWTDRIFQIELYDLVCNWIVFSDDGGDSWLGNAKGCGSLIVDHQTITAGPAAITPLPGEGVYPNMVYVCVNQIADSHCARSLNGGLTLDTFHIVYPGVDPVSGNVCGGIHGHAIVDPAGRVYLPREYCGQPYVAVSEDDGITWALIEVGGGMGATSGDPNMAFDATGRVYYTWMSDDEGKQAVWMVHSDDGFLTTSEPVRISHPDHSYANHVSITAGDDGRIGFVYLATTAEPDEEHGWGNVTWDAYMSFSHDAASDAPTFVHAQVNPEGDPVYRGDCRNIRCGYIREFLDASIAPDGSFWGAFVDACLSTEQRKYDVGPGDCNTEAGDYGQGNGHLGYAGHLAGTRLYVDGPKISGSG